MRQHTKRISMGVAEEGAWSDFPLERRAHTDTWDDEHKRVASKGTQMRTWQSQELCATPCLKKLSKRSAGLTASDYTATRVSGTTDRAIRNLLHLCDGSWCGTEVMTKRDAIEKSRQNEGAMVTISVCRKFYGVLGQERHFGGTVPIREGQSVWSDIAYEEDVEHHVCARDCGSAPQLAQIKRNA